jgi:hypothetical protein
MNLVIVQVVVGLSFLFFVLSVVASALNEGIAAIFRLRARMLERAILNLVTGAQGNDDAAGSAIVSALYAHPVVNGYSNGKKNPSYLSSRSFRNVLFSVTNLLEATEAPAADGSTVDVIRQRIEASLAAIQSENLKMTLSTIWHAAERDATEFRAEVEQWYDRGMERVSGWYKARTQLVLFIVGLVLAAGLNADAIRATSRLWVDEGLRQALIAEAGAEGDQVGPETLDRLEEMGVPLGWTDANRPHDAEDWLIAVAGWLATAVAVSFGAPFWFDLLNRYANLRVSGNKPATAVSSDAPGPTSALTVSVSPEPKPP